MYDGHQALLERSLEKAPQVEIMIRTMPWGDNNPFSVHEVENNLKNKLAYLAGMVSISIVPNIVNITYGRKVGYTIEQEHFDKEIEDISATRIRETSE